MTYVLITGGTSGIGYELARCFLRNDYSIIIVSSCNERLEIARKNLENEFQVPILTYEQDLAELGAAEKLYNRIKQDNIVIDVLINNAGYGLVGSTDQIDLKQDENLMILNIISLVELSKLFISKMYKQGYGKILNVASIGAFQPAPNTSTYCASKAFVLSYSRAIRFEAMKKGVQVCTLCPGQTKTNFFIKEGMKTPKNAMSAEKVAIYGYNQFMKNKEVIIPGFINNVLIALPIKIKMIGIARMKSK